MGILFSKLRDLLFSRNMEIALVGIENCGKTTFANQMAFGEPKKTYPTVGFNVRSFKRGNLKMKIWDLSGQVQARIEWPAYCKTCDVIIFMLDASNVILKRLILYL